MASMPVLLVFRLVGFLLCDSHLRQQLASLRRIFHHGLICLLLLSFDRHQRILSDFCRGVARRSDNRERSRGVASWAGGLLDLFCVIATENRIDPPFSEEESLAGVFIPATIVGSLVHPFDAINTFWPAGCFELFLSFFDLSLTSNFLWRVGLAARPSERVCRGRGNLPQAWLL